MSNSTQISLLAPFTANDLTGNQAPYVEFDALRKCYVFFTQTMRKMNVAQSCLDAPDIENWNESEVAVRRWYAYRDRPQYPLYKQQTVAYKWG